MANKAARSSDLVWIDGRTYLHTQRAEKGNLWGASEIDVTCHDYTIKNDARFRRVVALQAARAGRKTPPASMPKMELMLGEILSRLPVAPAPQAAKVAALVAFVREVANDGCGDKNCGDQICERATEARALLATLTGGPQ